MVNINFFFSASLNNIHRVLKKIFVKTNGAFMKLQKRSERTNALKKEVKTMCAKF